MLKKFSFVHLLLTLISTAPAFPQIKAGETAPALQITHWIRATPQQQSLQGKFLVLEFWATWCAPCLEAVPHVNELAETFKNEHRLVFLSLSDERTNKINALLSKVRFNTAVATDSAASTQRAFGISGIPYCVLIDDKMQVQWAGRPSQLTTGMLRQLLARTPIPPTVEQPTIPEATAQLYDSLKNAYSIVMSDGSASEYFNLGALLPHSRGARGSSSSPQMLNQVQIGGNLRQELAVLLQVSPAQIQLPPAMSDICISYCYKSTTHVKAKDIAERIARELDMEVLPADSLQEVISLEVTDTALLYSNLTDNPEGIMVVSTSDKDKMLTLKNHPLNVLPGALQQILNCPVVLKTLASPGKKVDLLVQADTFEHLRASLQTYGVSAAKSKERRIVYHLQYANVAAPKLKRGATEKTD